MAYPSLLLMIVFALKSIFVLVGICGRLGDRPRGGDYPGLPRWTLNATMCVFIRGGEGRFDTQRRR